MCPTHPDLSILNKPKVQATIVKLGELLEDYMGRMTAGTKYVPQPHGNLMQICEERTLPHAPSETANNILTHTKHAHKSSKHSYLHAYRHL
jgi:hypothetical protein